MKISYNQLKKYIDTDLSPERISELLTDCGLEVESVEKFESVKGSLKGVVIGEVKSKEKHPGADRLSVTTVDVGAENPLHIVCGAANVAAGQKVAVATVGSTLYPTTGELIEIKKSKIRGEISEGMICAEDEIGLGTSHAGIMVLDPEAKIGMAASEYFKLEEDHIFEIGLTPNRADAASHVGVARDLSAVLNIIQNKLTKVEFPSVNAFKVDEPSNKISVEVKDTEACPRYSGITISGVEVKESPEWLKKFLRSIGVRSINNIVDVTNFVLHELGQPLHAFDADKITGNKVIVKKETEGKVFKTLDEAQRKLSSEDLMICNEKEPMCIAGVFGGISSGVDANTKNIFLESAYFNSVSIRKTSKRHGLKTDASFRYERGTDPNIPVYALKRAALLIQEVAGGKITSDIIDIYPKPIENFRVGFSYKNCDTLVGQQINRGIMKNILTSLGMEIISEGADALLLSVPPYKPDVQREVDVIEEVLRVYGYNNIDVPDAVRSSISFSQKPDKEKIQNIVSDLLSNNGFSEIMSTSLTKELYLELLDEKGKVNILNPLSSDLNVLRKTLLFSGLEAIAYNRNRKNINLKLYEFGKTYHHYSSYEEHDHLALFLTGKKSPENYITKEEKIDFAYLKGFVTASLERLGINDHSISETDNAQFAYGLSFSSRKKTIVNIGSVAGTILKSFDIADEVFYADFNWNNIIELASKNQITYKEVSKFPSVRRDLALLLDKNVKFDLLKQIAFNTEKTLLKSVNIFDVYEGDKLEKGKKSYALSFILQDENATLTDKQVDKVMEKLIKTFSEKAGAVIR